MVGTGHGVGGQQLAYVPRAAFYVCFLYLGKKCAFFKRCLQIKQNKTPWYFATSKKLPMLPSTRRKGDVLPASPTRTRSQAGSAAHQPRLPPVKRRECLDSPRAGVGGWGTGAG